MSSSFSVFNDLCFLLYRSFISSIEFIPRYFIIFCSNCKWSHFPDLFLSLFIVGLYKMYWFLYINFVSCYVLKVFMISRSFLVEFLGSFRYKT
jgi:hypothetical protein